MCTCHFRGLARESGRDLRKTPRRSCPVAEPSIKAQNASLLEICGMTLAVSGFNIPRDNGHRGTWICRAGPTASEDLQDGQRRHPPAVPVKCMRTRIVRQPSGIAARRLAVRLCMKCSTRTKPYVAMTAGAVWHCQSPIWVRLCWSQLLYVNQAADTSCIATHDASIYLPNVEPLERLLEA